MAWPGFKFAISGWQDKRIAVAPFRSHPQFSLFCMFTIYSGKYYKKMLLCLPVCLYSNVRNEVNRCCVHACYLALMRYSAKLMLAGEPVMVTWRSLEPSTGLAILIWAPDIWRISFILAPWRPMMQPINCRETHLTASIRTFNEILVNIHTRTHLLTSFGMVSSWEPVCVVASMPAVKGQIYNINNNRNKMAFAIVLNMPFKFHANPFNQSRVTAFV